MSRFNLRKRARVSYYEPDEPNLDEYIFCSECRDYVYEYCAIHGPLLVIPDDKVPAVTGYPRHPACVPRAALTVPRVFLHLARSHIPGAGLGVFSTLTLPRGVRFGPYRGQRAAEITSSYCWQIYDSNNKASHVVDAVDAERSNWMRYVNCARRWPEQNLVAFQYRGELYYRTIKIIPRFTELLVYYGNDFAKFLHIDIKKYNSPPGYACKLGAPVLKKPTFQATKIKETITKENPVVNNLPAIKTVADTLPIINIGKDKTKLIKDNKKSKISNSTDVTINSVTEKLPVSIKRTKIYLNKKSFAGDKFSAISKGDDTLLTKQTKDKSPSGLEEKRKIEINNNFETQTEKRFACDVCPYKTANNSNFLSHIRIHTGEEPFKCNVCPYKCARKSDLVYHIRTHTEEKPFKCNICPYKCARKSHLVYHIRTHTGEKPFKCNICKYKCAHKSNLVNHIKTHTGDKPFKCNICPYKCAQKSNLVYHIWTHTEEKPFKCNICPYKCAQKSTLVNHIKTHTGDKPFKCNICPYKCARKSNLVYHIRTHTGEKPFKCNICPYKCAQKSTLVYHIRTHTGEKPFTCYICPYKSAYKRSLVMHLKLHMDKKVANQ